MTLYLLRYFGDPNFYKEMTTLYFTNEKARDEQALISLRKGARLEFGQAQAHETVVVETPRT